MTHRTMAPLVAVCLLASAASALAAPRPEVSRPRDPEEGGGLRKGLGLQVGSFVWQEGVSRPNDPRRTKQEIVEAEEDPDALNGVVADDDEASGETAFVPLPAPAAEEEDGGAVTIRLSPAVGEGLGLGLGPQLGSELWPEGHPGREDGAVGGEAEDGEDGGETEVSMPMSEQDVVGKGRTLALGPQMSARVSRGAKMESVPVWYAYLLESVGQSNGRFFQLCLLVNVILLVTAFYCNPIKRRSTGKQVR